MQKLWFIALIVSLFGCAGKNNDYDIELNFKVVSNGETVILNSSNHTNSLGQDFTVSKFQMLVSDVFLTNNQGSLSAKHSEEDVPAGDERLAEYHYFDMADSTTHTISKKLDEDDGRHGYLTFRFGLNQEDNQGFSLPNEDNYNNFAWMPASAGYHYMKFEGKHTVNTDFGMHAGPQGGNDYSFVVTIPIRKAIENKKLTLNILIDLDEFFSNDFNFTFPIAGIMGNATAQGHIKTNGQNAFSIE